MNCLTVFIEATKDYRSSEIGCQFIFAGPVACLLFLFKLSSDGTSKELCSMGVRRESTGHCFYLAQLEASSGVLSLEGAGGGIDAPS